MKSQHFENTNKAKKKEREDRQACSWQWWFIFVLCQGRRILT
jgi:hypothetical protein